MSTTIIPIPRSPVTVRPATPADLPFIDGLQKMHTHMVGWMPTKQIEGKIAAGHVLVAESVVRGPLSVGWKPPGDVLTTDNGPLTTDTRQGYCIGHDQYFKRDDVGIIYQMNVAPGRQRGFIGATLLRAMFERAAYGCRLFCCWCAQDIEANRFWESMGFVPLAYRAGSRGKGRVHIFWQKRIRRGDTATPYWFPSQTGGGSIREDRLVLPIPPGTHWSDAKPLVLPSSEVRDQKSEVSDRKPAKARLTSDLRPLTSSPAKRRAITATSGLRFGPAAEAVREKKAPETKPREPKRKAKNDPKLVAAARELRDRYLEQVNGDGLLLEPCGKYDVGRSLEAPPDRPTAVLPALPAPAAA